MSLWNMIETVLLGPLKLVFEVIFQVANRFIGHPGLAIVVLSLMMNILVLPLYKRADAMQEEARDTEARLKRGVDHIKKTFSGDERMMVLQTYYRQNNYKPTQALNGSISLLLEIPFFMAAYQFLSHLEVMNGVSFGPIADLSRPDGLLVIGGVAINVLPVLMTTVNVISSAIYLKGFPLKTKIQLYGMALFFLVFLYTSPSCLVFYWTLNNVFSLVKTIFYKLKHPGRVISVLVSVVGVALVGVVLAVAGLTPKRKVFLAAVGIALQLPLIWMLIKNKLPKLPRTVTAKPSTAIFLLGCIFLTVLVGALIPSTFIAASPQEYVDISYFHNPLWYIVSALCLAAGTFLVWMRVFYWLASRNGKVWFDRLVWVLCGIMLVNYMFFGTDLGVISSTLQYEGAVSFSGTEQLLNLLAIAAVATVMCFVICKWPKAVPMVLLTAVIAVGGMSAVNTVKTARSVDEVVTVQDSSGEIASIELSKTGKNVIVFMLDRGMGQQIPYIFNEKPELKESFSGFTYYSNVVSYGGHTNFCAPALYGGYEYTPVELNKRDTELLVEKHNEAIRVLPKIFSDNGYDITLCDPVYPNYQWIPDLSLFDDIPNTKAYITEGRFTEPQIKQTVIDNNYRNFFCFSLMKTMPLTLQPTIYNDGQYNQAGSGQKIVSYAGQVRIGLSRSEGLFSLFMEPYNVLCNLPHITKLSETDTNTFVSIMNNTAHEPQLLQTPDYVPAQYVDNTQYDAENSDRFTVDGRTLKMDTEKQVLHYHANMASMLKLGEWFDHLRELGVWDNTRIILVSDHGQALHQLDELTLDDGTAEELNVERYYPLLMVKDFDSAGFTTSDDFMTIADVPSLVLEELVEEPVNPYTGKAITMDEKYAHEQYVTTSGLNNEWDVDINNGYTFLPSTWMSVKDDIWDPENWTHIQQETVLKEHAQP